MCYKELYVIIMCPLMPYTDLQPMTSSLATRCFEAKKFIFIIFSIGQITNLLFISQSKIFTVMVRHEWVIYIISSLFPSGVTQWMRDPPGNP